MNDERMGFKITFKYDRPALKVHQKHGFELSLRSVKLLLYNIPGNSDKFPQKHLNINLSVVTIT